MKTMTPARIDAYRYEWAVWCEDGVWVVGLLDHNGEDHRPSNIAGSRRDADILLALLKALDIKTPGGLPFYPERIEAADTRSKP